MLGKCSEKKTRIVFGQIKNFRFSNNFCDWFYFDVVILTNNKTIVFEIDFKIFKKLSIASERHAIVLRILKNSD